MWHNDADDRVPDFVFLAHVVDVMSAMHAPFVFRSFSSIPFGIKPFLFPMWPYTFLVMLIMWAKSKTFLFSFYNLRGRLHETWVVPRFGFQVTALFPYSVLLLQHVCTYQTHNLNLHQLTENRNTYNFFIRTWILT